MSSTARGLRGGDATLMVDGMKDEFRTPGHPVEMFVWRLYEKVGRTWRRKLLRNTEVTQDFPLVFRGLPVGRYRVEWRDQRRWVCRVEAWRITERGLRRLPPAAERRPRRKVPPPIRLRSRPVV